MIDLVVSIVSHNHKALLPACLDSVFKSLGSLSARVVVLDNASKDGSAQFVAEQYPNVELIASKACNGFAANQNSIIEPKLSKARYFLLLNDDTEIEGSALEDMVQFMDECLSVGIAGACLVYPNGSPQSSYAAFPTVWDEVMYLWGLGRILPKDHRIKFKHLIKPMARLLPRLAQVYLDNWIEIPIKPVQVDWVCGACMMVRAKTIKQIGLLDAERFYMYYEDVDLCKRAAEQDWKTYFLPQARVRHFQQASRSRVTALAWAQSSYNYFAKHGSKWDEFILRTNIIARTFLAMVLLSMKWLLKPALRKSLQETLTLQRDLLRGSFCKV